MENNDNIRDENVRERKKMTALVILIITLAVSATSATYAFFALSANNTNTITGVTAAVESELLVSRVLPAQNNEGTGVMVPQNSANTVNGTNALGAAVNGGCVDANNNIVCQVYRISFENRSTSAININSLLTLNSTMTNLKWYVLKEENNVASLPASVVYEYPATFNAKYGNLKSVTALGSSSTLNGNRFRYWYVVIWIEEVGIDQYDVDGNMTFNGTVDVQAIDGSGHVLAGVTSTFTG